MRSENCAGLPPGAGTRVPAAVRAVLVLLVLSGCGASSATTTPPGGGGGGGAVSADEDITTGLTRWAPGQRITVPALRGTTLDGEHLDIADWRGQVVVSNTWGSWCAPCRKEAPDLARVWAATKAAGVRFVGIDTRDNDAAARAFTAGYRIGYPSLIDRDGELLLGFARVIPVSAVPTTIVVDPAGRVAARVIGAITAATLRGLIDDLRAERDTGAAARKPQ